MAAMRKCPSCGEPCADWRPACPECGFTFAVREARKIPVIEEDQGELQQLVDALEEGRPPPPRVAKTGARTITVTRDVRVRPNVHPTEPRRGGCLWITLALAVAVLVLLAVAQFPLQVIAACAVLFLLGGGAYFVVIVRR
jgi:hypothetical protein